MEVSFKKISEREFERKQSTPILFYDKLYSRCFGVIESKASDYRFGWQSDLLDPIIKKVDENIYAIGIDQNFAVVDFAQKRVLLNLSLFYNFHTVHSLNGYVFICTELEVLVINKLTFETVQSITLPDFFEKLVFEDEKIKVVCVGQLVVELKI
jgi:hypothetical protein